MLLSLRLAILVAARSRARTSQSQDRGIKSKSSCRRRLLKAEESRGVLLCLKLRHLTCQEAHVWMHCPCAGFGNLERLKDYLETIKLFPARLDNHEEKSHLTYY